MIRSLLAALLLATGIVRTNDPYLAQVAAERTVQLESHWANPLTIPALSGWTWAEVAGRNRYAANPVQYVVDGWMASPEHRPLLLGPYARIGCATGNSSGWQYFTCILGTPAATVTLPNTATHHRLSLKAQCAPDATEYAFTVTLRHAPTTLIEAAFDPTFAGSLRYALRAGRQTIITVRGGPILYVRLVGHPGIHAQVAVNATACGA